jgi:hypothetical protein
MFNPERFSAAELAVLNAALDILMERAGHDPWDSYDREQDEKSFADQIHNAWQPGMNVDELVRAVDDRIAATIADDRLADM